MALPLKEYGLIPPLEDMAGLPMPLVKSLRVDTIKLSHPFGEVPIRSLDHKVIVVMAFLSFPREVLWYRAPGNSSLRGRAIAKCLSEWSWNGKYKDLTPHTGEMI